MLARLMPRDWLLAATLVPIWLVCFALHVQEIRRNGLAQPSVYALPGEGDLPVVGGRPLEVGRADAGLRPGDRVVRVGGRHMEGAGHVGFLAAVLAEAGGDGRVRVEYERAGARATTQLTLQSFAISWFRVPFLLMVVGLTVLVFAQRPGDPFFQRGFVAFMAIALFETPFHGPAPIQTWASQILFVLGGAVALPLVLGWLMRFPPELDERHRLWPGWAWLAAPVWLLPKLQYWLGTPLPPEHIPRTVYASEALLMLGVVATLTWSYRYARPIGRRRIKWVIYGIYVAGLPMIVTLALPAFVPELEGFATLLGVAGVMGAAAPIGFAVALLRFDLLDVDRLIGATAAWSLALGAALGAALVATPRVGRILADTSGVRPELTQALVALSLAALAVPVARRLRSRVESLFFPERAALERGMDRLLGDLSTCRDEHSTLALVAEQVERLLRPTRIAAWERHGGTFQPRKGDGELPAFAAQGPVAIALAGHGAPLVVSSPGRRLPDGADPGPEAPALAALAPAVLLPLRREGMLAAFVAVGPKRSGDIYTPTDLSHLRAVTERASAVLGRIGAEERLALERHAAQDLRRLKDEAEAASRARTRLLAAASHDLRQPLHALGLFADALQGRVADEVSRGLVERIRSSTGALGEMFDALLDLSRLDAGRVEPRIGDIPLDPLLERLEVELEARAAEKGLALVVDRPGVLVRSDPALLGQILSNLLGNAVRYTEQGQVGIACRREGAHLRIDVHDSGPGIPETSRERIFDEFVQLGRRGQEGGLGLGLAIARRAAHVLDHPLRLASQPGGGSVFSLVVPVSDAPHKPPPPAPVAGALRDRRVLVVDDDLNVLEAMARVLDAWGCRVSLAGSPEEAREALRARPEVVVVDHHLGAETTGVDLVRALRSAAEGPLPALLVSADTHPEVDALARREGLARLAKPVQPARLRAALVALLRPVRG